MAADLSKPITGVNPSGTPVSLQTDASGNLKVAESSGSSSNPNGQTTMANSAPVVIASDQSAVPVSLATNTPDITDRSARLLGHVTLDNASVAVTGTFWQATQPVSLATNTPTLATGTNSIGTVQPGNTANTTPWLMREAATTTSSTLLTNKVLSAANTTPIQIKTSAGALYGWHLFNNAATVRYVRFFNVSSSPTMGTTSPAFVIPLPAGGGAVMPIPNINIPMGTGIFYAVTTGAADLDNTAGAANDVVGTIWSI